MKDLFGYETRETESVEIKIRMTPDRARTIRNENRIRTGTHPFGFALSNNGKTCGECAHAIRKDYNDKSYWKCTENGMSNGPATDLRLKWPSCVRFLEPLKRG